ncbi:hypothetical protein [Humibacter sp. RRB41]|uniref:hypothetical protein n=1 Tax=Humibacter sp. RRB41 TaxID=2919946 RepID=UPI001FAAC8A6|nr:hypothetical protein [Humibacter sp. RRB41]
MNELRKPYTPQVTVGPRERATALHCCARCKTPGFGCANTMCSCHGIDVEREAMIERGADYASGREVM